MIKTRTMKILLSESDNKKKLTQYVYLNVSFIIKIKETLYVKIFITWWATLILFGSSKILLNILSCDWWNWSSYQKCFHPRKCCIHTNAFLAMTPSKTSKINIGSSFHHKKNLVAASSLVSLKTWRIRVIYENIESNSDHYIQNTQL